MSFEGMVSLHPSQEGQRPMRSLLRQILAFVQPLFRLVGLELLRKLPEHHYVPIVYGRSAHKHIDIREVSGFGPLAALLGTTVVSIVVACPCRDGRNDQDTATQCSKYVSLLSPSSA